jgi:hypothetical protein
MAHKKLIVLVIILGLVGGVFVSPLAVHKASSTAIDFLYFLKEFIIYPLVRQLGNALENKLINSINGLINGLNQKTPSFITNWRNYYFDSQAKGNNVFRSVLADANLCTYFRDNMLTAFGAKNYIGALAGAQVKINVGGNSVVAYENETNARGLPSYQVINNCSLPPSLNVNAFRQDFNNGGWAAWDQLIQPQNNFYGSYVSTLGEQQKQINTDLQSAQNYSIAGRGFLGQKLNNGKPLGITDAAGPTGCAGASAVDTGGALTIDTPCFFMGKEVTPAELLGDTAANELDTKLSRIGGAKELTDVLLGLLSGVINALSNKVLNFIGLGSYQNPALYLPVPTPPGGINFNTGPVAPTAGDPNPGGPAGTAQDVCRTACLDELQSCLNTNPTVQTCDNQVPPVCTTSGSPSGVTACNNNYNSCTGNCIF